MHRLFVMVLLVVAVHTPLVLAQGLQTGTITGVVQSADHVPLAGATVSVTSPELLGRRTAMTDVNGVYIIKGLSPGTYAVAFEIANFQPATREGVEITVGATADLNTTMTLLGRTETVTVTATVPSPVATVAFSQAYTKRDVDLLPVGRRPQDIAELAPGLTNVTPNPSQVTISGATAFDNVFMVNGVDIDDNLFGSPHGLYIEDAIAETNILTGGISAEYGRFTGGVINIITKSGGNSFSGSVRENFSNPTWIRQTPREQASNITHADVLSKTSEGTFGGPLVNDRLWFFAAGRYLGSDTPQTFVLSEASTTRHDVNKRGELKFTGSLASGHTLSADYTNNSLVQTNVFSLNSSSLDPSVLINPSTPNTLFVSNYNGVIARQYFAMLQYSQKENAFEGAGGTNPALSASPFRTRGVTPGIAANLLYAAPFFSALDPEQRNNRQFTGSVSRTLSSRKGGTHDLKAGGEYFRSQRTGGNSQSATGYVFQADYVQSDGKPVYDSAGTPIPNFVPSTNMGLQGQINDAMAAANRGNYGLGGQIPGVLVNDRPQRAAMGPNGKVLAQQMGSSTSASPNGMSSPTVPIGAGPGGMGGAANADFDSLIDLIVSTVSTDTWAENGGGQAEIRPFPTNLSLVVSQTQAVHEQIADLLQQLRRLQDLQVTIEVRFIQLNDSFFERIGIDFNVKQEDTGVNANNVNQFQPVNPLGHSNTVGVQKQQTGNFPTFTSDLAIPFNQGSFGLTQLPPFGPQTTGAGLNFGFAILSDIEAYFLVEAAQGDTRTNVLNAPKVTLFNGQQAFVADATQRPFVVGVIPVVGEFASAQQPVIVVLNEGTMMTIQAVVSDDRRYVRMTIVPFFTQIGNVDTFTFEGASSSTSSSSTTDNDDDGKTDKKDNSDSKNSSGVTVQLPSFSFVSVVTTVSVPDGGTVLLGGIKRLSEGRNEFGVPLLSKVPYINRLFKNVSIGRRTNSLMMMVTPRIIIQEEEEERLGVSTPTAP